ncbi:MoaD/ThiS family protein [Gudongella sp. SC589]|jgi:molybdopterin converting factor small subunit|uniref:MoaD/ThiS family protein n=1 Tax=Gudongella sp. SC589 TaxID=3385990 RepID=UPI0039046F65
MKVKLKFMGVIDIEAPTELHIHGDATVMEVIEYLENMNSIEIQGLTVLVNKEKASLDKSLKEGDEILLLQPIGGG